MKLVLDNDTAELARKAALLGSEAIRRAISERGQANIVLATGASQFEVLKALCGHIDIDWQKVTAFHLDEYIGLPKEHPASFRGYLEERFVAHVPTLGAFHFIDGNALDIPAEIERMDQLIASHPIDVVFAGIGENGHLAFNDPPAAFNDKLGFKAVLLDQRCRAQQHGEGWFARIEDVPRHAITMTIPQIMDGALLIVSVAGDRKAVALQDALDGPVTPTCPASILRRHPACSILADHSAAKYLRADTVEALA